MDKTCPHCGAALPGEASFCPHCGESLHRRRNARMPRRVPARLLRALALLCLAVLLSAAAFYLVLVMLLTYFMGKLERRLRRSDH